MAFYQRFHILAADAEIARDDDDLAFECGRAAGAAFRKRELQTGGLEPLDFRSVGAVREPGTQAVCDDLANVPDLEQFLPACCFKRLNASEAFCERLGGSLAYMPDSQRIKHPSERNFAALGETVQEVPCRTVLPAFQ